MKRLKFLLLASPLCLLFGGCIIPPFQGGNTNPPVICGGTTNYTNKNAPKEIESKNIVEFETRFFIRDMYDDRRSGGYNIKIVDNEKGDYVFTIWGLYNHEMVVSDQVFVDIQDIIDKHRLVKNNGAGRITAGLAPEYGPWMLSASYDTGEKLYFCENGVPEAGWTLEFRDYFDRLMFEAGFKDVPSPKKNTTITKFSFDFNVKEYYHLYTMIKDSKQGGNYLLHHCYNMDTLETKVRHFASITDDFFEGLQEVIDTNEIDTLDAPIKDSFESISSKDGFLEFNVEYESFRQIRGKYKSSELPEKWNQMRGSLMDFLNDYIRKNRVEIE